MRNAIETLFTTSYSEDFYVVIKVNEMHFTMQVFNLTSDHMKPLEDTDTFFHFYHYRSLQKEKKTRFRSDELQCIHMKTRKKVTPRQNVFPRKFLSKLGQLT